MVMGVFMTKRRPGARKRVRVLTGRDQAAIKAIGKVGVAAKEQLNNYCGLTDDRLNKLCNSGYLQSRPEPVRGLGTVQVYTLGRQGELWLERDCGWTSIRHSHAAEIQHDLKLTSLYFNCSAPLREFWQSDKEAIYSLNLKAKAGRQNMPDAVIVVPSDVAKEMQFHCRGEVYTIAVEAIGSSYTATTINAKLEFAKQHFDQYVFK